MLAFTWVVSTFCLISFWLHHVACWILVPWPGIRPALLQWKHGVLTSHTPGNSFFFFFFYSGVISHRPPLLAEPGSVYIYIFFFFLNKFKYFWPWWVFIVVWAFSSYGKWGLLSNGDPQASACCGFLLWSTGPRACKLQQLWRMGSVAPCHVESSHTSDRTLCSLHWQADSVLNHWPTREVPRSMFTYGVYNWEISLRKLDL